MPPSHIAKWRGQRQFAILRGRRQRVRAASAKASAAKASRPARRSFSEGGSVEAEIENTHPSGSRYLSPPPALNVHAPYEDEGVKEDVTRDISDFDIGLVVGAGVELRHLTVDARYNWGLRSAFHDGELQGAFKNRTFSVMVGLRY